MNQMKLRSYLQTRQMQKNIHCASPVPGLTVSTAVRKRNTKANSQLRFSRLSEPRVESCPKKQVVKSIKKALPKIQEIAEVTQVDCSVELIANEKRSLELNKNVSETHISPSKESLHLNSSTKESMRSSETTSEMTLPTGVSDFILDCLDVDSSVDSDTESSGASSYSSPEIFRDEKDKEETSVSPAQCLGNRNSTLLDISNAVSIDKMPQLPNLSQILETTLGRKNRNATSDRLSKEKLHSKLGSTSTAVAGNEVHRILSAKEKTPLIPLSLPPEQIKENISTRAVSRGRSTSSTSFLQEEDLEVQSSSVHKGDLSEVFLPNSSDPCVNSEETVPSSLSPKIMIHQGLCKSPDICCIIKSSPKFKPLKRLKKPISRRVLFPPPGVTKDIIISPPKMYL